MIVVTGANGQLGRAVVAGLLARLPADRIIASVQDPAKATALAEQSLHIRARDFARPDSLAAAFAGAAQVLVVSVNKLGETAFQLHRAAIEAARAPEAGTGELLINSPSTFKDSAKPVAKLRQVKRRIPKNPRHRRCFLLTLR